MISAQKASMYESALKTKFFLERTLIIPYRNYVFKGTNLKTDVFGFDSCILKIVFALPREKFPTLNPA